jgi:hypothetical protein
MVRVDFVALLVVVGVSSVVLAPAVYAVMRWALAGESNRRSRFGARSQAALR